MFLYCKEKIQDSPLELDIRYCILSMSICFLFAGPLTRQEIIDIDKKQITNATSGKKKTTSGPMLRKTKQLLDKFYSKHNKALAELLQDDQFEYS